MTTDLQTVMEDKSPRPVRNFLVCGAVFALLSFATLVGYYSAACGSGSSAGGWALVTVIAAPLVYPQASLAVVCLGLVVAFGGSAFLQPAKSMERFGAVCLASLPAALAVAAITSRIAESAGASAKCSFGF